MNIQLIRVGLYAIALLFIFALTNGAQAVPFTGPTQTVFHQTFDVDSTDWFGFGSGPTLGQVASGGGTLGIASAGGSAGHLEVTVGNSGGTRLSSGFTRFGAYSSVWPGFIRQSLDIYIDPGQGSIGDAWALDNAVNDTSGDWLEAGGVGAVKTALSWWIAADADGGGYTGPATGGVGLEVTTAGWYTIVSEWAANVDGLTVDRNTYIYSASNALLYSSLNPQQVLLSDIGGNRYGWLLPSNSGQQMSADGSLVLAVDNSKLEILGAATNVPEPTTLLLFGAGLAGLGVARRRRRVH